MKKILIIILVLFILIQFFPIDKNNPAPTPKMDFLQIKNTPERTAQLIRNSCYDCHSNETKYPWYSNIQPIAWFLKSHIEEGRKELNFSTFATYEKKIQARKLKEAAEMIQNGEMPLDSYLIIHSEAIMTPSDKKELIDYFNMMERDTRILNDLPSDPDPSQFKQT